MKTLALVLPLSASAFTFTVKAPSNSTGPEVCSPCYEKPPACTGSETSVQITGVTGDFCSPLCVQNECPKGDGSFTAKPSCVLETQGSSKPTQCALICTPGANGACPAGATCQAIQGEGICTYPSSETEFTKIAAEVNAMADATWTADPKASERFGSLDDVKQLCGTWNKNHPAFSSNSIDAPTYVKLPVNSALEAAGKAALAAGTLPSDYDARTAHPNCTVISKIRDQSACGSCWAFGSTESFEDRRCIATGVDTMFSTEDTAGCLRRGHPLLVLLLLPPVAACGGGGGGEEAAATH